MQKGVLRNFTKFTGKHLCYSLFFNKVAGLTAWQSAYYIPWNFLKAVRPAALLKMLWPDDQRLERILLKKAISEIKNIYS